MGPFSSSSTALSLISFHRTGCFFFRNSWFWNIVGEVKCESDSDSSRFSHILDFESYQPRKASTLRRLVGWSYWPSLRLWGTPCCLWSWWHIRCHDTSPRKEAILAFVPNSSSCYSMRTGSNSRMGRIPLIWCCWPRCGCALCSPSQLSCPLPLVLLCLPFPRRPFFTWIRPKRKISPCLL